MMQSAEAFEVLANGAAVMRFELPSTVVEGRDGLHLLHRLLTRQVDDMQDGDVRHAFLCDGLGRAIDRFTVWRLDDQVLLSSLPGRAVESRAVLMDAVSWKDDVSLTAGDDALSNLMIAGRTARPLLIGLGIDPDDLMVGRSVQYGPAWFTEMQPVVGQPAYHSVIPAGSSDDLVGTLVSHGAVRLDDESWPSLRIKSGILGGGTEVDGTTIPLELAAATDIDLTKGCYPGQEIHARMESRGKLARTIIGFTCADEVRIGDQNIESGGRLRITSLSGTVGEQIGLALVRPAIANHPIRLTTGQTLMPTEPL